MADSARRDMDALEAIATDATEFSTGSRPVTRLDQSAQDWARNLGSDTPVPVFKLNCRLRDHWYNQSLATDGWFNLASRPDPTPVAYLVDSQSELAGIIHTRRRETPEICLSLVTQRGIWQTGMWFELAENDSVDISWTTDNDRAIASICMEIAKARQA